VHLALLSLQTPVHVLSPTLPSFGASAGDGTQGSATEHSIPGLHPVRGQQHVGQTKMSLRVSKVSRLKSTDVVLALVRASYCPLTPQLACGRQRVLVAMLSQPTGI
jgi:hypothetical protein